MIKRYDMEDETPGGAGDCSMVENDTGTYVTYEDHIAAMPKWVRFEDKLPSHCQKIIVTDGECISAGTFYENSSFGFIFKHGYLDPLGVKGEELDFEFILDEVTHWMPLPQPPEVKE